MREDRIIVPRSPKASTPVVRAVMRGNRSADTRPEVVIRSELHRRGLRFRKGLRVGEGVKCRADIAFTKQRVAVFVDGCFWHGCPTHGRVPTGNAGYWEAKLARNAQRDRETTAALRDEGWVVVRIWEHESVADAADSICRALDDQKKGRG